MPALARRPGSRRHAVAIALPDTSTHRTKVGHILGSLDGLGIRVFWVAEDGTVS
ncbi:hypothetical protein GS454_20155 [Rhodococcus hoagii]|nr:hypothetical protein [Prescottella equi]